MLTAVRRLIAGSLQRGPPHLPSVPWSAGAFHIWYHPIALRHTHSARSVCVCLCVCVCSCVCSVSVQAPMRCTMSRPTGWKLPGSQNRRLWLECTGCPAAVWPLPLLLCLCLRLPTHTHTHTAAMLMYNTTGKVLINMNLTEIKKKKVVIYVRLGPFTCTQRPEVIMHRGENGVISLRIFFKEDTAGEPPPAPPMLDIEVCSNREVNQD